MALTMDMIRSNERLSALTDEQIAVITEMSRNDESSVIGQKTGEIYGGLDADILSVSGIAKNGTEKTYDYAKRVIGEIKGTAAKYDEAAREIKALTDEKARLEKVIADGGADAETKRQLTQAQSDLASVTKSFTDLKAKFDAQKDEHVKELFDIKLDGEFAKATNGLKFKSDIPQSVTDVILSQAVSKVKGMFPEFIDDGKGGKVLAFKDGENGAIMRNPERNLNPYTASELVEKELKTMGVLDSGRKKTGAGTEPQGGRNSGVVDIAGARTQDEAYEAIASSLMAQGMTIGSNEFDAAMSKAWAENNIKSLPVK